MCNGTSRQRTLRPCVPSPLPLPHPHLTYCPRSELYKFPLHEALLLRFACRRHAPANYPRRLACRWPEYGIHYWPIYWGVAIQDRLWKRDIQRIHKSWLDYGWTVAHVWDYNGYAI